MVPDLAVDAKEQGSDDKQLGGSLGPTGDDAADGWLPVLTAEPVRCGVSCCIARVQLSGHRTAAAAPLTTWHS